MAFAICNLQFTIPPPKQTETFLVLLLGILLWFMVMTACGERPFSRHTLEKIWNRITHTTKILPTFYYFSSPLVDNLRKNVSEFYLVFKGLPSIGQNQFWRDGLKMWMKASIGFCPQRADLILLTDEVRGRAGFLRPQVEANVVRRLIFITLEERFQNLSHKFPPRTFL